MDIKFAFHYFLENWKMVIHLLFRTKRFGVNNKWWSNFDSFFGWSNKKIFFSILKIRPIVDNYKMMKFRAAACHFLPEDKIRKLGWYRYWEKAKK